MTEKDRLEIIKLKRRLYYLLNREKVQARHTIYRRNKRKTDHEYRMRENLRRRIRFMMKNFERVGNSLALLGCSMSEFRIYIESKFQEGMSWDNYGLHGWHLDHIRPCSSFNLLNPEEQKICFHYTNLQPLWAKDNLRKSDKYLNNSEKILSI